MRLRVTALLVAAMGMAQTGTAAADPADQFSQMGKTICKGPHLRFTEERKAQPADLQRAQALLAGLRKALQAFRDPQRAIDAGYVPFLPDVPQDVYHFSSRERTSAEYSGEFALERPGSLLYRKRREKFELIGAMYSAPEQASAQQLDRFIPLSVTHWHAHINVCLPKGIELGDLVKGDFGANAAQLAGRLPEKGARSRLNRALNKRYGFMADGRFGFEGSIADPGSCEIAGGHFIPQAWGWMAHVYPFAGDDIKVAFGESAP